jgi:hypothetical protein
VPQAVVPRQLPAVVARFAGRASELEALTGFLNQSAAEATLMISAVAGTAGVGKTALAVRWAHQVADRFPDGQLCVDLRGYDPDQPVTAASALARFLRDLESRVPAALQPILPKRRRWPNCPAGCRWPCA